MDMNLRHIPEKNIVFAEVIGEANLRSVQQAAIDGFKLGEEYNCNKYLIDLSKVVIKYPLVDVIMFVEGLSKMGFSRRETVAFVISRAERAHKFWETVAINRGWGRIAYFQNSAEAEKWLMERQ